MFSFSMFETAMILTRVQAYYMEPREEFAWPLSTSVCSRNRDFPVAPGQSVTLCYTCMHTQIHASTYKRVC